MFTDRKTTIEELKQFMKNFITEREWNQYHTPKNLSMAIAIEAGELMEHFLWIENNKSQEVFEKKREEIENEIADILSFMLSLANACDIDLSAAFDRKMKINAQKYSVEKAKGRHTKYTEL